MPGHRLVGALEQCIRQPLLSDTISDVLSCASSAMTSARLDIIDGRSLTFSDRYLDTVESFFKENGALIRIDELAVIMSSCHGIVKDMGLHHVTSVISETCMPLWDGIPLQDLVLGRRCNAVIGLILVTARLEWIIGVVVMTSRKQLKDNLRSDEASTKLGNFVFLLQVLMGSVKGLNVKNLCWHGFVSPTNIPCPIYSFTLICALTLTSFIRSRDLLPSHAPSSLPGLQMPHPVEIPPAEVDHILTCSALVHPEHQDLWRFVFEGHDMDYLTRALHLNVVLLQHALRLLWVTSFSDNQNTGDLQRGRSDAFSRATAQNDEFYVTFDEVFAPRFTSEADPSGLRNGASYFTHVYQISDAHAPSPSLLLDVLGEARFHALLDLFVHGHGLRLRDKLSHGELGSIPAELCNHVRSLSLAILGEFCPSGASSDWAVTEYGTTYIHQFHPSAIITRHIHHITVVIDTLSAEGEDVPLGSTHNTTDVTSPLKPDLVELFCGSVHLVPQFQHDLNVGSRRMIYYKIAIAIVSNLDQFLTQFHSNISAKRDALRARTLRSRQRRNFAEVVAMVPWILKVMGFTWAVMGHIEYRIWTGNNSSNFLKDLQFLLKCTENMASLVGKSKWTELGSHLHLYLQRVIDKIIV